ncbi:hypothetical protein Bpfe_025856 [Biomphalaria pfeifferi]|uniref:Uncharacterized protein n=1 Tax=Biomphalaria pfeifferi TaxID=112525 RepID=A0AAD8AYC0_BIOPF|nr:hypothetical protein Bpfe_025856 [Biomphalaria pfeifferi]
MGKGGPQPNYQVRPGDLQFETAIVDIEDPEVFPFFQEAGNMADYLVNNNVACDNEDKDRGEEPDLEDPECLLEGRGDLALPGYDDNVNNSAVLNFLQCEDIWWMQTSARIRESETPVKCDSTVEYSSLPLPEVDLADVNSSFNNSSLHLGDEAGEALKEDAGLPIQEASTPNDTVVQYNVNQSMGGVLGTQSERNSPLQPNEERQGSRRPQTCESTRRKKSRERSAKRKRSALKRGRAAETTVSSYQGEVGYAGVLVSRHSVLPESRHDAGHQVNLPVGSETFEHIPGFNRCDFLKVVADLTESETSAENSTWSEELSVCDDPDHTTVSGFSSTLCNGDLQPVRLTPGGRAMLTAVDSGMTLRSELCQAEDQSPSTLDRSVKCQPGHTRMNTDFCRPTTARLTSQDFQLAATDVQKPCGQHLDVPSKYYTKSVTLPENFEGTASSEFDIGTFFLNHNSLEDFGLPPCNLVLASVARSRSEFLLKSHENDILTLNLTGQNRASSCNNALPRVSRSECGSTFCSAGQYAEMISKSLNAKVSTEIYMISKSAQPFASLALKDFGDHKLASTSRIKRNKRNSNMRSVLLRESLENTRCSTLVDDQSTCNQVSSWFDPYSASYHQSSNDQFKGVETPNLSPEDVQKGQQKPNIHPSDKVIHVLDKGIGLEEKTTQPMSYIDVFSASLQCDRTCPPSASLGLINIISGSMETIQEEPHTLLSPESTKDLKTSAINVVSKSLQCERTILSSIGKKYHLSETGPETIQVHNQTLHKLQEKQENLIRIQRSTNASDINVRSTSLQCDRSRPMSECCRSRVPLNELSDTLQCLVSLQEETEAQCPTMPSFMTINMSGVSVISNSQQCDRTSVYSLPMPPNYTESFSDSKSSPSSQSCAMISIQSQSYHQPEDKHASGMEASFSLQTNMIGIPKNSCLLNSTKSLNEFLNEKEVHSSKEHFPLKHFDEEMSMTDQTARTSCSKSLEIKKGSTKSSQVETCQFSKFAASTKCVQSSQRHSVSDGAQCQSQDFLSRISCGAQCQSQDFLSRISCSAQCQSQDFLSRPSPRILAAELNDATDRALDTSYSVRFNSLSLTASRKSEAISNIKAESTASPYRITADNQTTYTLKSKDKNGVIKGSTSASHGDLSDVVVSRTFSRSLVSPREMASDGAQCLSLDFLRGVPKASVSNQCDSLCLQPSSSWTNLDPNLAGDWKDTVSEMAIWHSHELQSWNDLSCNTLQAITCPADICKIDELEYIDQEGSQSVMSNDELSHSLVLNSCKLPCHPVVKCAVTANTSCQSVFSVSSMRQPVVSPTDVSLTDAMSCNVPRTSVPSDTAAQSRDSSVSLGIKQHANKPVLTSLTHKAVQQQINHVTGSNFLCIPHQVKDSSTARTQPNVHKNASSQSHVSITELNQSRDLTTRESQIQICNTTSTHAASSNTALTQPTFLNIALTPRISTESLTQPNISMTSLVKSNVNEKHSHHLSTLSNEKQLSDSISEPVRSINSFSNLSRRSELIHAVETLDHNAYHSQTNQSESSIQVSQTKVSANKMHQQIASWSEPKPSDVCKDLTQSEVPSDNVPQQNTSLKEMNGSEPCSISYIKDLSVGHTQGNVQDMSGQRSETLINEMGNSKTSQVCVEQQNFSRAELNESIQKSQTEISSISIQQNVSLSESCQSVMCKLECSQTKESLTDIEKSNVSLAVADQSETSLLQLRLHKASLLDNQENVSKAEMHQSISASIEHQSKSLPITANQQTISLSEPHHSEDFSVKLGQTIASPTNENEVNSLHNVSHRSDTSCVSYSQSKSTYDGTHQQNITHGESYAPDAKYVDRSQTKESSVAKSPQSISNTVLCSDNMSDIQSKLSLDNDGDFELICPTLPVVSSKPNKSSQVITSLSHLPEIISRHVTQGFCQSKENVTLPELLQQQTPSQHQELESSQRITANAVWERYLQAQRERIRQKRNDFFSDRYRNPTMATGLESQNCFLDNDRANATLLSPQRLNETNFGETSNPLHRASLSPIKKVTKPNVYRKKRSILKSSLTQVPEEDTSASEKQRNDSADQLSRFEKLIHRRRRMVTFETQNSSSTGNTWALQEELTRPSDREHQRISKFSDSVGPTKSHVGETLYSQFSEAPGLTSESSMQQCNTLEDVEALALDDWSLTSDLISSKTCLTDGSDLEDAIAQEMLSHGDSCRRKARQDEMCAAKQIAAETADDFIKCHFLPIQEPNVLVYNVTDGRTDEIQDGEDQSKQENKVEEPVRLEPDVDAEEGPTENKSMYLTTNDIAMKITDTLKPDTALREIIEYSPAATEGGLSESNPETNNDTPRETTESSPADADDSPGTFIKMDNLPKKDEPSTKTTSNKELKFGGQLKEPMKSKIVSDRKEDHSITSVTDSGTKAAGDKMKKSKPGKSVELMESRGPPNYRDAGNRTLRGGSLSRRRTEPKKPPPRVIAESHYYPHNNTVNVIVKPINISVDKLNVKVQFCKKKSELPPLMETSLNTRFGSFRKSSSKSSPSSKRLFAMKCLEYPHEYQASNQCTSDSS